MQNKKFTFTNEITEKIVRLSHLSVDEAEKPFFTKQFNETLKVVDQLNKIPTKNVTETSQVTGLKNILRQDFVDRERMLSQEEALKNAKRINKGYFVVKGILDEK